MAAMLFFSYHDLCSEREKRGNSVMHLGVPRVPPAPESASDGIPEKNTKSCKVVLVEEKNPRILRGVPS
jgi:hypothetical protein